MRADWYTYKEETKLIFNSSVIRGMFVLGICVLTVSSSFIGQARKKKMYQLFDVL